MQSESDRRKLSIDVPEQRFRNWNGSTLFSQVLDLPAIADSTIALSFSPASDEDEQTLASFIPENITDLSQLPDSVPGYLVNVEAELVIGEQEQATGATFTMGDELSLNQALYNPQDGWEATNTTIVAGEYHAIGVRGTGIGAAKLEQLQSEAESAEALLTDCRDNDNCAPLENLNRHQLVGTLLQAGVLGWFALTETQNRLAALQQNAVYQPLPSYGKFSSSAQTQYNWGIPRAVSFPGVLMDIDFNKLLAESGDGDVDKRINFVRLAGTRGSANEHLVPGQH